MKYLKEECEKFLNNFPGIETLITAERYSLSTLQKTCIEYLQKQDINTIQAEPHYERLSAESVDKILSYKQEVSNKIIERMMNEVKCFVSSGDGNQHSENCRYKGREPHPGGQTWESGKRYGVASFTFGSASTTSVAAKASSPMCFCCFREVFDRIYSEYISSVSRKEKI